MPAKIGQTMTGIVSWYARDSWSRAGSAPATVEFVAAIVYLRHYDTRGGNGMEKFDILAVHDIQFTPDGFPRCFAGKGLRGTSTASQGHGGGLGDAIELAE